MLGVAAGERGGLRKGSMMRVRRAATAGFLALLAVVSGGLAIPGAA